MNRFTRDGVVINVSALPLLNYKLATAVGLLFVIAVSASPTANASPLPDLPVPQCFGVNIHFGNDRLAGHIAWLKKAGIGWVRRDLSWSEIERTKGVYDFGGYDVLVGALHAAGIKTLFILDYGNPNYDSGSAPVSDEAREAFSRFAAAAAKRYAGKVDAWEIFNEPNIDRFWKPAPNAEQYAALANDATRAIRQGVPGAVIVGPALSGPFRHDLSMGKLSPTFAFLDRVLQSQAAHEWSAITIHPYPRPKDAPESAIEQFEAVRKMMQSHGIDVRAVPVIAGEWGYSTFDQGVDENTQAAYAVRAFLIAAIEHMPFSIWYDWQDDGSNNSDSESRFGLLRHTTLRDGATAAQTAKPSFNALEQFSALLAGYRFDALVTNSSSVMVARYVKGAQPAWVAWSVDNAPHTVTIALPAGRWVANHLLIGAKELTPKAGQRTAVDLDQMPVVMVGA